VVGTFLSGGARVAASMGKGKGKQTSSIRRSVPADDQEARSVGQFIDRLGELGWKPQGPRKDYGEDFLVQIWDDGVPSDLSFYVQLKSIKDAEKRKGKRVPSALRYPLEVKDIEHWEVQVTPVVLIVWDIEKRVGYWETIPRIVEALEEVRKGWRKKTSVSVRVPVENGTDDEGMRRLRKRLADAALAVVSGKGDMTFTMQFPDTGEGKLAFVAFQNALDRGEQVILEGPGMPEIHEPTSYQRLYGGNRRTVSVTITPKPNKWAVPVRIEIQSPKGTVTIPYVELSAAKEGRKHLTLTNEHQNRPIVFILSGNDETGGTLTMRFVRWGRTIQEARETVAFYSAMQHVVSHIRVFMAQDGTKVIDLPFPPQRTPGLEEFHDTLEKLAFIEPYIAKYGPVSIDGGIDRAQQTRIAMLYEICKYGRVKTQKPFQLTILPSADEIHQVAPEIVEHLTGCMMKLLGLEIPLGRVRRVIHDSARVAAAMRDGVARARATGTPVPICVEDVEATEEFLDWPPPHDRILDLASTQSGYFTLTQAIEAGFTSAEQLQIQERVELAAEGVYRFVHYPPSDHEDLVVTWLQTEKLGVFSHDTALALHELSDILPARQHITVPPGWKPVEGMRLSANTVVHYGTVSEAEMSWMGPVPFTKPLRTLFDCIEKGLTPDLVIQGIEDARRRGMISHTDAESLRLANMKSA
jgi:hypothetical protein